MKKKGFSKDIRHEASMSHEEHDKNEHVTMVHGDHNGGDRHARMVNDFGKRIGIHRADTGTVTHDPGFLGLKKDARFYR